MGDRSVIITWEYDSAFIYQMEYATRWSNDWTNRPLVEAQVITGQESFDGLVAGETYKFHMRAIGKVEEGQNYYSTTEWSEYSHPILVTLGPPPAPDSLGVSSKTETSVILSYGPVSGATYQVQYRKTTPDDSGSWDPYPSAMPVTGSTFQVDGLEEGTEYDFQVRAMGDGSRWTNEAGPWSSTLVVRTVGYTTLPPPAPILKQCWNHVTDAPRAIDTDDHTFPSGSSHSARVEMYGNAVINPLSRGYPDYCVQVRYITRSTPGADTITWQGEIRNTISSITWEEARNWRNWTPSRFYALYTSDPPASGASADLTTTYTCSQCKEGTIQTGIHVIPRKYIKTSSAYVTARHTVTENGVDHTLTTSTKDDATQGDGPYWENVALEIAEDLLPEQFQPIIEWLKQSVNR